MKKIVGFLFILSISSYAMVIASNAYITFRNATIDFEKVSEYGVEPWSANYEVYYKSGGETTYYEHGFVGRGSLTPGNMARIQIDFHAKPTIGYDEIILVVWTSSHNGTNQNTFNYSP